MYISKKNRNFAAILCTYVRTVKQNTYILRLACTLVACLLASFFACAHAYSVSLGTNISNAPFIQDTATANVSDGAENFFRLEAEHLPATVCYWSDSIFGPIPVLVNVATDDTLSAVRVSENCRMGWKWSIAEAGEEETVRYLNFSAHENNAMAEIRPTVCMPTGSEVTEEACDSLLWNGEWHKASGDYEFHTTNAGGCDSTVILHLTIHHRVIADAEVVSECNAYTWHNKNYTQSGIYQDTLQTIHDCDSICTLQLTIKQPTAGEETREACVSYEWHGKTYTESGDYTYETTNVAGCDSTATLHLTIKQPTTGEETKEACNSYDWHGKTYTESGDYTFKTTNVAGCDSTATLHLTIKQPTTGEETKEVCNEYEWHEQIYTESGDYTFKTTNAAGCDSTVTLHLTIKECLMTYDTVYFCAGQNTEHEELLEEAHVRRYIAYAYESPAEWDYMEGAILVREKERMQVDLRRAEENLYAHYVNELTPVSNIRWSFRADGESEYRTLEVANEPQWVETGTIAVTVRFVCGQFYTSDFEADVVTVNGEEQTGRKVLENGQIIIIRGGVKYNVFGLVISD